MLNCLYYQARFVAYLAFSTGLQATYKNVVYNRTWFPVTPSLPSATLCIPHNEDEEYTRNHIAEVPYVNQQGNM